jgi:RHS repeat-associated protein
LLAENEDSSVEGFNPFRYRSYVYDTETELYYLQSRYYDPKTGRFINADDSDYTDTDSGSPLSTNMFAYCENNAISGYDPNGTWKINDHIYITRGLGFSKTTVDWSVLPDKLLSSDSYYSAPFHSRSKRKDKTTNKLIVYDGLDCATYMYNMAITMIRDYYGLNYTREKKQDAVQFAYTKPEKSTKEVIILDKRYMGFLKKDGDGNLTNTVSINCEKAKRLISELNNRNFNRKDQSEAMLGLALHTFQDYFAHRIQVYGIWGNFSKKSLNEYPKREYKNNTVIRNTCSITEFNGKIKWSKNELEDAINVLPWRFNDAIRLSYSVYYGYYYKMSEMNLSLKIGNLEKTPKIYFREKNIFNYLLLYYKKHSVSVTWK